MDKNTQAIIGYKIFSNEAEFVNWQKEQPRSIFQISPVHIGIAGTGNNENEGLSVDLATSYGIFVTYKLD